MDGQCEGCKFSAPAVGDDEVLMLKCHRYPAQLFVLAGVVTQAFPDANERCGEYKQEPLVVFENLRDLLNRGIEPKPKEQ